MVRRLLLLGALLALLVPASAAAKRTVPRGWLGVNAGLELSTRPELYHHEFGLMRKDGVESVRLTFNWDEAEPTPGHIDFSATDRLVAAAAKRHLRMLVTVLSAPQWASDDTPNVNAPILTPRHPSQYAHYLGALVGRYGPHGSFWRADRSVPKVPIRSWQIWNEPNLSFFWNKPGAHKGQDDTCFHEPWVRTFVPLLRAASKTVHRRDKGAKVVLPGMPNSDWAYLCSLYHHGARPLFDEAAAHPYSLDVSGVVEFIKKVRATMAKHGDRRKPLLLTELSWPASKGKISYDPGFAVTPRGQVRKLEKAIPLLARDRHRYHLGGVYWYTWVSEFNPAFLQPFQYSGLRRVYPDGHVTTEPGLGPFRRIARRLEGRH